MTRTAFQPVWLVADMQVSWRRRFAVPDRPDQHSPELLNRLSKVNTSWGPAQQIFSSSWGDAGWGFYTWSYDPPEGHPGQLRYTLLFRILSTSLTSVSIFSACCCSRSTTLCRLPSHDCLCTECLPGGGRRVYRPEWDIPPRGPCPVGCSDLEIIQRWAVRYFVLLCAIPLLAQQGKWLRTSAVIRNQLIAE